MHFVWYLFSRAHTIVGITFIQKQKNEAGKETAKTAVINLVDLAGRYATQAEIIKPWDRA